MGKFYIPKTTSDLRQAKYCQKNAELLAQLVAKGYDPDVDWNSNGTEASQIWSFENEGIDWVAYFKWENDDLGVSLEEDYYGKYSDDWEPGAIDTFRGQERRGGGEMRYYIPPCSHAEHFRYLNRAGWSKQMAYEEASRSVRRHYAAMQSVDRGDMACVWTQVRLFSRIQIERELQLRESFDPHDDWDKEEWQGDVTPLWEDSVGGIEFTYDGRSYLKEVQFEFASNVMTNATYHTWLLWRLLGKAA